MVITITLAQKELDILNVFFVKSYGFTLNSIIDKFRLGEILTPEIGKMVFDKGIKKMQFGASELNAAFIDSIKIGSKIYTVRSLIASLQA
jgi:hypothetical protein